jgi:endonuclease/exonuclease/phosphatase (EEP) superfamily protein YafD
VSVLIEADPPVAPGAGGAERPRWCRATRALVFASVGWWILLAAHDVLSGRWWFWLLPDLAPPLAYVAVPVVIFAAVAVVGRVRQPLPVRPRRFVIVSGLLAVVLGTTQLGVVLPASGSPGAGTRLKVFSWNTGYWDQDGDPRAFLDFLTAQHADVYLLQEHLHWDIAAGLTGARPLHDLDTLRTAFPGYSVAAVGELATLSRFPIVAQDAVGAPPGIEIADYQTAFTAAKVLRTDLQIGGEVVSAYNVHLPVQVNLAVSRHFLGFVADRYARRTRHLKALDADLAANPNPVLVSGDFNTSQAMGDLDPLRDRLHDAARGGSDPIPASWPAGFALWRLDWTFLGAGLHADGYRLVDPAGLSDHRAQDVAITLLEDR